MLLKIYIICNFGPLLLHFAPFSIGGINLACLLGEEIYLIWYFGFQLPVDTCHSVCVCTFYIQENFWSLFSMHKCSGGQPKNPAPHQVFPLGGSAPLTTSLQLARSQFWCCYEPKSLSYNLQKVRARENQRAVPKSCT